MNHSMDLADRIAQHTHPDACPCCCAECAELWLSAARATDDLLEPLGDGVTCPGGDA